MGARLRPLPVFIKISPDLELAELEKLASTAQQLGISAIVATNTTLARTNLREPLEEKGGLSGAPLLERSLRTVRILFEITSGKLPILGVGGIFSAHDAVKMIGAGASLVQIYTGLIYSGPFLTRNINLKLLSFLTREGISSIKDVVGNSDMAKAFELAP